MDYEDEEIVGEGPCEFCGELFPLMLLIEHESIHLAEDNEQFPYFAENSNASTESVPTESITTGLITVKPEVIDLDSPVREVSPPKISLVEENEIKSVDIKIPPKIAVEQLQKQSSVIMSKKSKNKNEELKEYTKESGEKLLVYGCDIDAKRDLEDERQMCKMPSNSLSNSYKENDIEDINNLSDDDDSESLEEFWKRARDVLKRNRTRNECS